MSQSVTPVPPARAPSSPRALVAVLAVAGITVSLQQTTVIPLVPQLPRLLQTSTDNASWVVTATLLAAAVATPTVGRLADMVGKRRMLLVCMATLVVGSVVAALSSSLVPLVVGRALQGLAAGVVPLGISLMRDHLTAERLASGTALMSASLGVGGALGLPLSALLAQYADWHALFWAAAGLAVVAAGLVLAVVPESTERSGGRFDGVGALLLSITLVSLLLGISKGSSWGWVSPTTVGLFAATAVALGAFGAWELRRRQPLIDLRVSRRRQVLLTNTASAVFGFSMLTSSLVFPQLLQLSSETGYGFGTSILVAGLLQAPGGLCMMAMSPVSARISVTAGPRTTMMVGAVVVALGYTFAAVFHAQIWQLLVSTMVVSSGVGLAYGAMPSLIMAAVPASQTAAANSLNNLCRALGTSTASAVAGMLLASLTTSIGGRTYPAQAAFVIVLFIGAATAALALVVAVFIPRRPTAAPDSSEPADGGVLVHGVVRREGRPVTGAVLTVVTSNGRQLGTARSDGTGAFAIDRDAPGDPHLLIARSAPAVHAQMLATPAPTSSLVVDMPPAPAAGATSARP